MRVLVISILLALCRVASAGADLVVVIDRAMPPEKLEVVTGALGSAFSSFGPDDRVAVIAYARTARVLVPLREVVNESELARKVGAVTYAEGGGAAVGLRAAYDLLARSRRSVREVVLVTDRDPDDARALIDKLSAAKIAVRAIGYQSSALVRSLSTPAELRTAMASASTRVPVRKTHAVVLLVDRSGSMSGTKLAAAKELVRTTIEVLHPDDMISVVGFDTEVTVVVGMRRAANKMMLGETVSRLTAGGGTNIYAALKEARDELASIGADVKQVVLLTDGGARTDGVLELVGKMYEAHITVSAVGLSGADRTLLAQIAEQGNGRLYLADDTAQLPRLFLD